MTRIAFLSIIFLAAVLFSLIIHILNEEEKRLNARFDRIHNELKMVKDHCK